MKSAKSSALFVFFVQNFSFYVEIFPKYDKMH